MEPPNSSSSTSAAAASLYSSAQFNQVVFHDLNDWYPTDKDLECSFSVHGEIEHSSKDRIGIFHVGWQSIDDAFFLRAAPKPTEPLVFKEADLPKDDKMYQLCYVTEQGTVAGASVPFFFRSASDLEWVTVEDAENGFVTVNSTFSVLQSMNTKLSSQNQLLKEELDLVKSQLSSALMRLTSDANNGRQPENKVSKENQELLEDMTNMMRCRNPAFKHFSEEKLTGNANNGPHNLNTVLRENQESFKRLVDMVRCGNPTFKPPENTVSKENQELLEDIADMVQCRNPAFKHLSEEKAGPSSEPDNSNSELQMAKAEYYKPNFTEAHPNAFFPEAIAGVADAITALGQVKSGQCKADEDAVDTEPKSGSEEVDIDINIMNLDPGRILIESATGEDVQPPQPPAPLLDLLAATEGRNLTWEGSEASLRVAVNRKRPRVRLSRRLLGGGAMSPIFPFGPSPPSTAPSTPPNLNHLKEEQEKNAQLEKEIGLLRSYIHELESTSRNPGGAQRKNGTEDDVDNIVLALSDELAKVEIENKALKETMKRWKAEGFTMENEEQQRARVEESKTDEAKDDSNSLNLSAAVKAACAEKELTDTRNADQETESKDDSDSLNLCAVPETVCAEKELTDISNADQETESKGQCEGVNKATQSEPTGNASIAAGASEKSEIPQAFKLSAEDYVKNFKNAEECWWRTRSLVSGLEDVVTPFHATLAQPVVVNTQFRIQVKTLPTFHTFTIQFLYDQTRIPLQMKATIYPEHGIILNSLDKIWGQERSHKFCLRPDCVYEMSFVAHSDHVLFSIQELHSKHDDSPSLSLIYLHRIPMSEVRYIHIAGDVLVSQAAVREMDNACCWEMRQRLRSAFSEYVDLSYRYSLLKRKLMTSEKQKMT